MQILPERAYRILDYYRSHETKLAFAAKILGEEAACAAKVKHVWPKSDSIGIQLSAENQLEDRGWNRLIPLTGANFFYVQIGDPDFAQFANPLFHSLLIISFPDGTIMFFAEPDIAG